MGVFFHDSRIRALHDGLDDEEGSLLFGDDEDGEGDDGGGDDGEDEDDWKRLYIS